MNMIQSDAASPEAKLPLKPRISRILGAPTSELFPDDEEFDEVRCVSRVLEDASAVGKRGEEVTFDRAILRRIELTSTVFARITLRDASLSKCDLANSVWRSCFWDRVEVQHSRMTGLDIMGGSLNNITFSDCKANLACLRAVRCKRVRFENCDLREADFQGADLRGCTFRGCNLQGAQLSGAKLAGVDLREAKIEGIIVSPNDLSGVKVDLFQAAYLAGLMGLIID
jgi:uncharacterized protein YjbI with pentapeptide repeats